MINHIIDFDKNKPHVRISGKLTVANVGTTIGSPIIDEQNNMIGIITDVFPDKGFWYGEIYKDSDLYLQLSYGVTSTMEIVKEVE